LNKAISARDLLRLTARPENAAIQIKRYGVSACICSFRKVRRGGNICPQERTLEDEDRTRGSIAAVLAEAASGHVSEGMSRMKQIKPKYASSLIQHFNKMYMMRSERMLRRESAKDLRSKIQQTEGCCRSRDIPHNTWHDYVVKNKQALSHSTLPISWYFPSFLNLFLHLSTAFLLALSACFPPPFTPQSQPHPPPSLFTFES